MQPPDPPHAAPPPPCPGERGATGVEYALLVAAVSGLMAGGVFAVGREAQETFSYTCTALTSAGGSSNGCGVVRRRTCPPPANNPACTNRVGGVGGGGRP